MVRKLPVTILLWVAGYGLWVNVSFAQVPTSAPGNAWENFKNQFFPDSLSQVNCSGLPAQLCGAVKPVVSPTLNATANSTTNTQATGNSTDNQAAVGNAAGQYIIASGIHNPTQVSPKASTNIFEEIFASIGNLIASLFGEGEKQAKNYAGTILPQEAAEQNFAQNSQSVNSVASGNSNVLGIQTPATNTNMDRAFPLIQCGALPAGLCNSDNKPNFVQ